MHGHVGIRLLFTEENSLRKGQEMAIRILFLPAGLVLLFLQGCSTVPGGGSILSDLISRFVFQFRQYCLGDYANFCVWIVARL